MVIESVRVRNFRPILDETLDCESLTVLVGANGTGKSAFLHALDLFYATAPKVEADDFYDGDVSQEISIAVCYRGLTAPELKLFGSYMQGDLLAVERVVCWNDGKPTYKLHGESLQHAAFTSIRTISGAKLRKAAYEELRKQNVYADLSPWRNEADALQALRDWEGLHADVCQRARDDGQFFGFTEVAQGYLGRFTRFLLVPAVRDAVSDAAEGRGSVLSVLMDLVVRSVLARSEALKQLRADTQKRFDEIVAPDKLPELSSLAGRLTQTLQAFVPSAGIVLRWLDPAEIDLPMPKADVKLVEDGYESSVVRTGHGLQRAFVLTMLQHLAAAQSTALSDPESSEARAGNQQLPNLVLAIEEPELYQHPSRQRHLAKVLNQLAVGSIPGVANSTQVLYCTHAPLLVGIDRIDQVRLLRKAEVLKGRPKVTKVVRTTLDAVAKEVWQADGSKGSVYTGATLVPRLKSIMTPWMSEGFFADTVVLVEGEDDRAALLGVALSMGHDLESPGIAVIPCGGKQSIDRPLVIFRQLGIPTYAVWDSDQGEADAKPEDNHRLLRLHGLDVTDWPSGVFTTCACFAAKLENTMRDEFGPDEFDRWLAGCQQELGIPKRKHALKNAAVVAALVQKAAQESKSCPSLSSIVTAVQRVRFAQ